MKTAMTSSKNGKQKHGRILVVDDTQSIRESLAFFLYTRGYDVETASEGEEAVECYQSAVNSERFFDFVVVDLEMPNGWDGLKTLENIRFLNQEAKIILMTASVYSEVYQYPEQFGFNGVLAKPFELDQLLEYLEKK